MKMLKIIGFAALVAAAVVIVMWIIRKPHKLDGPGSVYVDSDYRSEYANTLNFDSYDGNPYFAAAFLGYGDRRDFRNEYVQKLFAALDEDAKKNVGHFSFEGDEWYLVVPRYRDEVEIADLETGEIHRVYNGTAFTVKCNLSDLHPNVEISTHSGLDAHKFSPSVDGTGRMTESADVWDITDYSIFERE